MLKIKNRCESCGKDLPPDSTDAMICSFECTFCMLCVDEVLCNVCPNCGGGFHPRPVRPRIMLEKYPADSNNTEVGFDKQAHQALIKQYGLIDPDKR